MEQANNLEVFKSKHNMGANYAMDYHRGTVTPIPVQVSIDCSEMKENLEMDPVGPFLAIFLPLY